MLVDNLRDDEVKLWLGLCVMSTVVQYLAFGIQLIVVNGRGS